MSQTQESNLPTPGVWNIDPSHSSISFVARHMMVTKVRGAFGEFSGQITVDENLQASKVEASVVMASVDTRDAKRDEHLRSPEFFDVDNHKTMEFRSTSVKQSDSGWQLTGDLTIKGVTRPVTLDLEYTGAGTNPWGMEVAGFEATTKISRKDFGLEWNVALETGGVLVGDEVKIELDIQAVRAQAESEAPSQA